MEGGGSTSVPCENQTPEPVATGSGTSNRKRHHRRAKKRKAGTAVGGPPPPPPQIPATDHPNKQSQHKPSSAESAAVRPSSSDLSAAAAKRLTRPSTDPRTSGFPTKPQGKSGGSASCSQQHPRRRCRKSVHKHHRGARGGGGAAGGSGGGKGANPVLRPTKCPHAPKNSTQYIIEDHGNDDTRDYEPAEGGGRRAAVAAAVAADVAAADEGAAAAVAPEAAAEVAAGKEENDVEMNVDSASASFWLDEEYCERDFQNVYESAHHDEVAEWDRGKLIDEISNLEARQKELMGLLSRLDPDVYLRRLQTKASSIIEKNRVLKMQIKINSTSVAAAAKAAAAAAAASAGKAVVAGEATTSPSRKDASAAAIVDSSMGSGSMEVQEPAASSGSVTASANI